MTTIYGHMLSQNLKKIVVMRTSQLADDKRTHTLRRPSTDQTLWQLRRKIVHSSAPSFIAIVTSRIHLYAESEKWGYFWILDTANIFKKWRKICYYFRPSSYDMTHLANGLVQPVNPPKQFPIQMILYFPQFQSLLCSAVTILRACVSFVRSYSE